MLHPTIEELTNENYNRYEIALATAKCARMITDEYATQREVADRAMAASKDADKTLINKLNKEYREEKAIKSALTKISTGEYRFVRKESEEQAAVLSAEEAAE